MSVRCVVRFKREFKQKANYDSFEQRLTAMLNMDGNHAVVKAGRGGGFFIHYNAKAMPWEHLDVIENKLGGQLKNTFQEAYKFHNGSVDEGKLSHAPEPPKEASVTPMPNRSSVPASNPMRRVA